MSDPFSVAASAVSVASLGIQVCQGLTTYYSSWKDYDNDITSFYRHLEGLSVLLQQLQDCLSKDAFSPATQIRVEEAMRACQIDVNILETELAKIRRVALPGGLRGKLMSQLRRAQYPFKEATLMKLKGNVMELQENVQLAVDVLGLELLGSINPKMALIEMGVNNVRQDISTLGAHISAMQPFVEGTSQEVQNINQGLVSTSRNVVDTRDVLQGLVPQIAEIESNTSIISTIKDTLEALPLELAASITLRLELQAQIRYQLSQHRAMFSDTLQKIESIDNSTKKMQLQLISKPSLLGSALDEADSSEISTSVRLPSRQNRHPRSVTMLEASIAVTRGAGGFSISPHLDVRAFVRKDSPAFNLFARDLWNSLSIADPIKHMHDILHQLQRLFDMREAAPSDVDINGRTVLSMNVGLIVSDIEVQEFEAQEICIPSFPILLLFHEQAQKAIRALELWVFIEKSFKAQFSMARQRLLRQIVQMGVPIQKKDIEHALLQERGLSFMKNDLIEAEWQTVPELCRLGPGLSNLHYSGVVNYVKSRDLDGYSEVYDCGILSEAILLKSEACVESMLKKYPNTVHEANSLKQTPLHLAVHSPRCVMLLLRAGAPVGATDKDGFMPIDYAANGGFLPAVKDLAAADSPITFRSFYHPWKITNERITDDILQEVCQALAQRRKQLEKLAQDHLSECSLINRTNPGILDRYAREVYEKLRSHGISVPEALYVHPEDDSIYHWLPLTISRVKIMYAHGFKDVDIRNRQGKTPLTRNFRSLGRFGVCEALISRGADLSQIITEFGSTQAHVLAEVFDRCSIFISRSRFSFDFAKLSKPLRLVVLGSQRDACDKCKCSCSIGGCRPLDIFLKDSLSWYACSLAATSGKICLLSEKTVNYHTDCISRYRENFVLLFNLITRLFAEDVSILNMLSRQIIRHFLFVELGITHTCCKVSDGKAIQRLLKDEIAHIHDEEKELLHELESLCAEANAKWAVYHGSLGKFIFNFLDEIRARPTESLAEEELRKIADIGVVLDQSTETFQSDASNTGKDELGSDTDDERADEWEDAVDG
ncbi:hypothetical protein MMC13_004878 [Lambiella insularis]|nr:hypothetical protein [Lambiella insularis]